MIKKTTLDFLKKLKKNNNRDWFEKNKELYLRAKENAEEVIQDLISELAKTEKGLAGLEARKCMFRIYRDIRFAKDKRPYKNNMGASINEGGKKVHDVPGYYIHFEPGQSFIAGGLWMPEAPKLNAIRQEIDYNAKEFSGLLKQKDFKKYFGSLSEEDKLVTAPKGYEKTNPMIETLKLKSFIVVHDFKDADITSKTFVKKASAVAKAMRPLNDFLRRAMD
jgi:uncharacterized protein (TIGR02453 family)